MLFSPRFTTARWCFPRQLFTITAGVSTKRSCSSSSSYSTNAKEANHFDEDCADFLPWLEQKAGAEISSKLYMGKSAYGRSLFASKRIEGGECILKVPYNVQLRPDNLPRKVKDLIGGEVGDVSKLALVLLIEQRLGQASEWAPYVSLLPKCGEMHCTMLWNDAELDMIRPSSVFLETIKQRAQIEKDFVTIKLALEHLSETSKNITIEGFKHAYALVGSRAWKSTEGVSLIPFADFLNHDGVSAAVVLNDEEKQVSEVTADHDYAPHEEVLIRYGRYPNATLLQDFGFTLPHNSYDQIHVQISIPQHDALRYMKLEILQQHHIPATKDVNAFNYLGGSFMVRALRSAGRKGKGIPEPLRAFARVLCCNTAQELSALVLEAASHDGRIARRPLEDSRREIQAHEFLLSVVSQLIEAYEASIKSIGPVYSPPMPQRFYSRRRMVLDLLTGELRVLQSVSAWLENYCTTLMERSSTANASSGCGQNTLESGKINKGDFIGRFKHQDMQLLI